MSLFAALGDKREGLSVMKDSLFTGAACVIKKGDRPGRGVIAERREYVSIPDKNCRAGGFFEGCLR